MSEGPRNYSLNHEAANELERESQRGKVVLERLAAHLAATQAGRDPNLVDLVETEHVNQAAELLFGSTDKLISESAAESHCVFLSYSHDDEPFIRELADGLEVAGVSCFKADRDIQGAADWAVTIWEAVRRCTICLPVLTPRFLKSPWYLLEGGAACASGKKVLTVLRYVQPSDIPAPFDRFQAIVVENSEQLQELVKTIVSLCDE